MFTLTAEQLGYLVERVMSECSIEAAEVYAVALAEKINPDTLISDVEEIWENLPDSLPA